ncbi:MAG TPA: PSD1 and planctomycete cytochrome C domain-containing protein [Pirellulales bacterium]|jgi:hypothetical protein|nr:PSD1 and planctomycete cytochrome C domain-containing protein [Pirellulales bacterium]
MHWHRLICGITVFAMVAASSAWSLAADNSKKPTTFDAAKLPPATAREVDFIRDVRPLFEARCWKCHGEAKHESGLSLFRKESAFAGGDGGKAFEPGKSAESRLIRYVSGLDSETVMPPEGEGERLTAEQVGLLRGWIDQGAKWPAEADTAGASASTHWAYKKPERATIPAVKNSAWPRNEIDYFVLARLEKEGLAPQSEVDRARLIRRVSLDLVGLPPTVEEVDAFLADKGPDAYEKVVDRLLASSRYGERWARPWLDLARYADTHGYEKDTRRSMWPYRDWVINALNKNMPFDQFTIEQLAGDLLPNATLEQKIATGFHRNTMINMEGGVDPEEYRVAAVIDRVNTTATVWLGTTLGCCQCHSHKYDPFKQKEYYQFMAFFNNTADTGSNENPKVEVAAEGRGTRDEGRGDADRRKVEPVVIAAIEENATDVKSENGAKSQSEAKNDSLVGSLASRSAAPAETNDKSAEKKPKAKKKPEPPKLTTLVMQELPKPREQHLFVGGSFLNPGEVVSPNVPAVLNPFPADQPRNRLGLAKWLVDPANPLTARVAINRIWAQYFGSGIVLTIEDFGTKGERPMHPELLDWLATDFIRRDWDLKAMHRLIVTSATYRQSSRATPELLERDPQNRLLARGPRVRLEAELVRDQALAASGLLSPKIGGPSVMPPQPDGIWSSPYSGDRWATAAGEDRCRRGLYTFWKRTAPYPSFTSFDAPSREFCVVRRPRTNTPLQALAILNDPVYIEAAQALARRMVKEPDRADATARLVRGFRLCLARTPEPAESDRLLSLYNQELDRFRGDAKSAQSIGGKLDGAAPAAELAAWTVVANVLLNLDETLNKG